MKKLKKKYKSTNCYRKVPHLNKIIERKKGNLTYQIIICKSIRVDVNINDENICFYFISIT